MSPQPASRVDFDGVVCFGGVDWWYHNRGHYDLQMMRELSARLPVVYVNSLGMRVPQVREGRMFARRIGRKLRSITRGAVTVAPGFTVFSPLAPPALRSTFAARAVAAQVQRVARAQGIRRPLVWVACPPARHVVPHLDAAGVVFQRTDRFEAFDGIDPASIGADVAWLLQRSDLVLYCSRELRARDGVDAARTAYVDHGIDLLRFAAAGDSDCADPPLLAGLRRPRAGFVGGVDAHTFDPALFAAVTRRLPDVQFVVVGGRSLPDAAIAGDNVALLGRVPFAEVPAIMAACDVLLMPWRANDWIRSCNPIKLKEYLAVGRPVVSTPFPELAPYADVVRVGDDAATFADHVQAALAAPHDPRPARLRLRGHGWDGRADAVLGQLARLGVAAVRAQEAIA